MNDLAYWLPAGLNVPRKRCGIYDLYENVAGTSTLCLSDTRQQSVDEKKGLAQGIESES